MTKYTAHTPFLCQNIKETCEYMCEGYDYTSVEVRSTTNTDSKAVYSKDTNLYINLVLSFPL